MSDGRYNRDEPHAEQVVHITKGYNRDHRPYLNQLMLALIVEPQAGIPVLMEPLSGNSRDPQAFGQVIHAHIDQLQTMYGATYVLADSALYSEAYLQKLAQTAIKRITQVPATVRDAQLPLAQPDPSIMPLLQEGYRYQELTSGYVGVAQRWGLIYAEARQALLAFVQDFQVTFLASSTASATPCDDQRGRLGKGVHPIRWSTTPTGPWLPRLTPRQALIHQYCCVLLATNATSTRPN